MSTQEPRLGVYVALESLHTQNEPGCEQVVDSPVFAALAAAAVHLNFDRFIELHPA